jgi:phosphoglycolate phosphatase
VAAAEFRLYVFDLDGTLIDSRRDIAAAANELLADCGAAPLPEQQIARLVGDGAALLVARAFAAAGVAAPPDALERFLAIYDRRLTDHTRPYSGIPETLAALRTRGVGLGVLTNKPRRASVTILERLDLARFFAPDLVVGGDGPLPRKPDPAGLRQLMARAEAAPHATLLVGDSSIDWQTARAAATRICMAAYGFGFEGFPLESLGPDDFCVESPAGLLTL